MGIKTLPDLLLQIRLETFGWSRLKPWALWGTVNVMWITEQEQREVSSTPRNEILFVLIVIFDLDLVDMCPHFTELPKKTPCTPVQQSFNHTA